MKKILLVSLLFVSGCVWEAPHATDYITEPMPIIYDDTKPDIDWSGIKEENEKGLLSEREKELVRRAYLLAEYDRRRDARINNYNDYANKQNEEYRKRREELVSSRVPRRRK
jgi:hypothetical protein